MKKILAYSLGLLLGLVLLTLTITSIYVNPVVSSVTEKPVDIVVIYESVFIINVIISLFCAAIWGMFKSIEYLTEEK